MDTQKLIEEIVNELYKKLQQGQTAHPHKKKIVLIGNREWDKELEKNYQIIQDVQDVVEYDEVMISRMSIGTLSRLALGCGQSAEEEIILKALLEGKSVYVLEDGLEYRQYKKTSHKTLYTLYSDYENKIKQYGIQIISSIRDLSLQDKAINQAEVIVSTDEASETVDFTHKKLLLETDLMRTNVQRYGTILVDKKCIVTPLAEDFIRSHKLKIKRR